MTDETTPEEPAATGPESWRLQTKAIRGGHRDGELGLAPAIHPTTTFITPTVEEGHRAATMVGHEQFYSRYSNPTQDRLERALAALEGGAASVVYGSGMAAAVALFHALPAGSHVLLGDDIYFSIRRVAREQFPRWGLAATAARASGQNTA